MFHLANLTSAYDLPGWNKPRWFKPCPFHPLVGGHEKPLERVTFSPSQKGHRFESPGGSCFCENVYDDLQLHKACGEICEHIGRNEKQMNRIRLWSLIRLISAMKDLEQQQGFLKTGWTLRFSTEKMVIKRWCQVLSYVLNTAAGTQDLMIRFHLGYYSKNGQPGLPRLPDS